MIVPKSAGPILACVMPANHKDQINPGGRNLPVTPELLPQPERLERRLETRTDGDIDQVTFAGSLSFWAADRLLLQTDKKVFASRCLPKMIERSVTGKTTRGDAGSFYLC